MQSIECKFAKDRIDEDNLWYVECMDKKHKCPFGQWIKEIDGSWTYVCRRNI